jgi:hypothetical protein
VDYAADLPNSRASISARAADERVSATWPWLALLLRTLLFAACQGAVAAGFALAGATAPWAASIPWWPLSAAAANLINIAVLARLTRAEGIRFADLFRFDRRVWKRDAAYMAVVFVLLGPIAILPSSFLSIGLWNDPNGGSDLMFRALPMWAIVATFVVLPVSIALSELPTYFGYALPRLEVLTGRRWPMLLLASAALAFQHVALPLVLDGRYFAWRLLMYAPFALFVGWALDRRPTLMPYFMVIHGLIDMSIPVMLLLVSTGKF